MKILKIATLGKKAKAIRELPAKLSLFHKVDGFHFNLEVTIDGTPWEIPLGSHIPEMQELYSAIADSEKTTPSPQQTQPGV